MIHKQYAVSLGSQKPDNLRKVEHSLWSAFFNMAAGLNATTQMKELLDGLELVSGEDNHDWFVKGQSQFINRIARIFKTTCFIRQSLPLHL
jgi:hypothetical protein